MPIAAKFSEAFYQRFGHEATGELVEYLNAIDATHRPELERLNEANWLRLDVLALGGNHRDGDRSAASVTLTSSASLP